jgi:hypothetical protein
MPDVHNEAVMTTSKDRLRPTMASAPASLSSMNRTLLYTGFSLCALFTLTFVSTEAGVIVHEIKYLVGGACAAALILGVQQRAPLRYWIACAVTAVLWIASIFVERAVLPNIMLLRYEILALSVIVSFLVMLIVFRVRPLFYVALLTALSGVVGVSLRSVWWGLLAMLVMAGTLGFCNYVVQLVLDHRHEFAALRSRLSRFVRTKEAAKILVIWIPALVLAAAGFYLNWKLQVLLKEATYKYEVINPEFVADDVVIPRQESEEVEFDGFRGTIVVNEQLSEVQDCEITIDPPSVPARNRDLERDVLHQVCELNRQGLVSYERELIEAKSATDDALDAIPFAVDAAIEAGRPPTVVNRVCEKARIKRIGSFKGLCRGMLGAVDDTIQGGFNNIKQKSVAAVIRRVDALAAAGDAAYEDAQALGAQAVGDAFDQLELRVRQFFLLMAVMKYLSYLILAAGLIAAFQFVTGRVLFDYQLDTKLTPSGAAGRVPTFRLSAIGKAQEIPARMLQSIQLQEIALPNAATKSWPVWYVKSDISREGDDAYDRMWFPQLLSCVVQRIRHGCYALSRIESKRPNEPPQAEISVPGDTLLVVVRVLPGQSIVFRMGSLAAFSSGIRLKSVYSTHIGTHLLGLGSFYPTARGDGYVVLKTQGTRVAHSKNNTLSYTRLIAWDEAHEFSLMQNVSIFGVWMHEASLKLCSVPKAAIFDESAPPKPTFLGRLWRLFRYVLLPF